jgi:hypothetical protein
MSGTNDMMQAPCATSLASTMRWSDADNPSVSAIFLWQGINRDHKAKLSRQHGGEIGIAQWVMQFASICEDSYHKLPDDLDGVFHYEVVEDMGDWLGNQHRVTHDSFRQELERRIKDWL